MKVLKILLLIIIWPLGLVYLINIIIKKNKQKKALANVDFDKNVIIQSYIEIAKQEKNDIMKIAF